MRTFTLLLDEDGAGEARKIEFSGFDPSAAFVLLKSEKAARKAILLEQDKRLGTIVREDDDFWKISA